MTPRQYIALAARTAKAMPTPVEDLEHAALGLITELGELATELKRLRIYGRPLDGKHVAEEIGDILWYWALAMRTTGETADITWADYAQGAVVTGEPTPIMLSRCIRNLSCDVAAVSMGTHYGAGYSVHTALIDMAEVLTAMCRVLGMDMEQIAWANIEKLRQRYPEAYSDAAAEARADKGGADARNS